MEPRPLTHVPAENIFISHQARVTPESGRPILHPRFMTFTNYLGADESYIGTRTCKQLRRILSRSLGAGIPTSSKLFGILIRFRNCPLNLQFIWALWLDSTFRTPIYGEPSSLPLPPFLVFFLTPLSFLERGQSSKAAAIPLRGSRAHPMTCR